MISRALAVAVSFAVLAVLAGCGGSGDSDAHRSGVAVLVDPNYVDYDPLNPGSEGSNVEAVLGSGTNLFGAGVNGLALNPLSFTGATTPDLAAALAGRKILVVPEQERGSWTGALDFDAIVMLRHFVEDGGIVIAFWSSDRTLDLADAILETALLVGFPSAPAIALDAGATGTPFAGGPASLANLSATAGIVTTSLPANARVLYSADTFSVVTLFTKGSGHIVTVGWDFFASGIGGPEIQPWVDVLRIAATQL